MDSPIVTVRDLSYTYPGSDAPALDGAGIELYRGEVHCLVGENGSGKSTLMHILSGYIRDGVSGIIEDGDALIRMVHQHPLISDELKVWEHLAAGHPRYFRKPFVSGKAKAELKEKLESYPLFSGLSLYFDKSGRSLSPLMKHHLSLASAVLSGARVLILDEPSAHLSPVEKNALFDLLARLKEEGAALVLITHKINELEETGDRVTVLKKGKTGGTWSTREFLDSDASSALISASDSAVAIPSRRKGPVLLSLMDVSASRGREHLHKIDLDLHAGEILGITGLRGEGLDLLEQVLAGIAAPESGTVTIRGTGYPRLTPKLLRSLKIGYIPTDRLLLGATGNASIEDNMILLSYRTLHSNGVFKRQEIDKLTSRLYRSFGITGGSPGQPLKRLSGGNIQRVIVSREFSTNPDIVIFAEPYWGLDGSGKALIRDEIARLSSNGTGIIILSPEIDDVTELCPRIMVLYEGRVALSGEGIASEEIASALLGMNGDGI